MDRIAYLKNLVVMAIADGALAEHELSLLSQRCAELGFEEQELCAAVSYALGDDAQLELPTDAAEQEAVLSDLIRMMAADGQMSESEKRLFALAAARMDFSGEKLERLIDRVVRTNHSA
ncbi:tellurite resistance TerB family protein [Rosistilla ulvae]|nr:TerB family tellurite resistance protein [Rosistilla ulvae]